MSKKILVALMLLALMLLLTSCVPGDGHYTPAAPANFFSGVWHGFIVPLTLAAGIFNGDLRIYEVQNIGWWYDCGFFLGFLLIATIVVILGIRSAAARRAARGMD